MMEAFLYSSFDEAGKADKVSLNRRDTGLWFIPALLGVVALALAIAGPELSHLMSQAAEAEMATSTSVPETAPRQFARPFSGVRVVRAN
jgi:hypothetical protein